MNRKTYNDPRALFFVIVIFMLSYLPPIVGYISYTLTDDYSDGTDEPSAYTSYVIDDGDLFTQEEENLIKNEMMQFSDQCHVIVATGNSLKMQTAEGYYSQNIPKKNSCVVLFIDTNTQQISIYSAGHVRDDMNTSHITEITDNLYPFMMNGDYVGAVTEGLHETYAVLTGEIIIAPMRYINNAFLALAIAAILMFLFIHRSRDRASDIDYGKKIQGYIHQTSHADFPNPYVQ